MNINHKLDQILEKIVFWAEDLSDDEKFLSQKLKMILEDDSLLEKFSSLPIIVLFRILQQRPNRSPPIEDSLLQFIVENIKNNDEFYILFNLLDFSQLSNESTERLLDLIEHDDRIKINNKLLKKIKANLELCRKIFPIHSLYITRNNQNPHKILGFGEWLARKDKYLLCASDYETCEYQTEEGGNNNVVIQKSNLPNTKLHFSNMKTSIGGGHKHCGITESNSSYACTFTNTDSITNIKYTQEPIKINKMTKTFSKESINDGNHFHEFTTKKGGSHYHYVEGETDEIGENEPIIIQPEYLKICVWERVS